MKAYRATGTAQSGNGQSVLPVLAMRRNREGGLWEVEVLVLAQDGSAPDGVSNAAGAEQSLSEAAGLAYRRPPPELAKSRR